MSADNFLVYYGLRIDFGNWEDGTIDEAVIEQLELEEHPLLVLAAEVGLDTWWGNFSLTTEQYLLFIGKELGMFGWEAVLGASLSDDELQTIIPEVKAKLKQANLEGEPKLWMQFEPDHN